MPVEKPGKIDPVILFFLEEVPVENQGYPWPMKKKQWKRLLARKKKESISCPWQKKSSTRKFLKWQKSENDKKIVFQKNEMSEEWISPSIFFLQVRKKSCLRPHPTVNRTTAPKIVTARKGYETTKIMAHETIIKFTYFWYNLIFLEKLWRKWIIEESSQTPNLNAINQYCKSSW